MSRILRTTYRGYQLWTRGNSRVEIVRPSDGVILTLHNNDDVHSDPNRTPQLWLDKKIAAGELADLS